MRYRKIAIRISLTVIILLNGYQNNSLKAQELNHHTQLPAALALSSVNQSVLNDEVESTPSLSPLVSSAEPLISSVTRPTNLPDNHAVNAQETCPGIQSHEPLCESTLKILSQIQEDPVPEVLYAVHEETIGRHYLFSDEKHPDLFKEMIENKSGT